MRLYSSIRLRGQHWTCIIREPFQLKAHFSERIKLIELDSRPGVGWLFANFLFTLKKILEILKSKWIKALDGSAGATCARHRRPHQQPVTLPHLLSGCGAAVRQSTSNWKIAGPIPVLPAPLLNATVTVKCSEPSRKREKNAIQVYAIWHSASRCTPPPPSGENIQKCEHFNTFSFKYF